MATEAEIAATREIVRHLGCGRDRAQMAAINLRRIGLATGRKVPRDNRRGGPRTTTLWALANYQDPQP